MLTLFLFLAFLPSATASLSRKSPHQLKRSIASKYLESFRPTPASNEFQLTATTEVLLDGKPCRYEDVPEGATIILLETATNLSKEILKIHFQTRDKRTSAPPAPTAAGRPRTPNRTVP